MTSELFTPDIPSTQLSDADYGSEDDVSYVLQPTVLPAACLPSYYRIPHTKGNGYGSGGNSYGSSGNNYGTTHSTVPATVMPPARASKLLENVQYLYENGIINWPNFTVMATADAEFDAYGSAQRGMTLVHSGDDNNGNSTTTVVVDDTNYCLPNCGLCTSSASDFQYIVFNLVLIGALLPLVGLCGVVGNSLSAYVYSRPSMRKCSNNLYLCALGCSDNAVILTALFLFFLDSIKRHSATLSALYSRLSPVIYPAGMMAQTCSVYFTVVAGIDCFVQVCLKSELRNFFARQKFVLCAIASVLIFSFLYNVPHGFEAILIDCWHTQFHSRSVEVCPAPFRFNPTYTTVYYKYMYSIFLAVGPLILLIFLNSCIILVTVLLKRRQKLAKTINLQQKEQKQQHFHDNYVPEVNGHHSHNSQPRAHSQLQSHSRHSHFYARNHSNSQNHSHRPNSHLDHFQNQKMEAKRPKALSQHKITYAIEGDDLNDYGQDASNGSAPTAASLSSGAAAKQPNGRSVKWSPSTRSNGVERRQNSPAVEKDKEIGAVDAPKADAVDADEAPSDDNMALILVVLLFIACNTIALLINVFETHLSNLLEWRINYIIDVSNLLVVFNSSFNIVIYYNFSLSYRTTFLDTVVEPWRRKRRRDAKIQIPAQIGNENSRTALLNDLLDGGAITTATKLSAEEGEERANGANAIKTMATAYPATNVNDGTTVDKESDLPNTVFSVNNNGKRHCRRNSREVRCWECLCKLQFDSSRPLPYNKTVISKSPHRNIIAKQNFENESYSPSTTVIGPPLHPSVILRVTEDHSTAIQSNPTVAFSNKATVDNSSNTTVATKNPKYAESTVEKSTALVKPNVDTVEKSTVVPGLNLMQVPEAHHTQQSSHSIINVVDYDDDDDVHEFIESCVEFGALGDSSAVGASAAGSDTSPPVWKLSEDLPRANNCANCGKAL